MLIGPLRGVSGRRRWDETGVLLCRLLCLKGRWRWRWMVGLLGELCCFMEGQESRGGGREMYQP